ncbi:MAG TPA: prepilin-type N-terminal cleavage/methylation domain-containing protein [Terriglobales bacterium]|nr:prepilin-type N-terminal cleavage/methylation domain-containing protein [Terriglobales bacterium]
MKRQKQSGFSLIELLIVVAIILIIAAIAIPNLLRSKIAANEASAVQSMRAINTAEITYYSTWGTGFAPLPNLGGPNPCPNPPTATSACILDSFLSQPPFQKSGYAFGTPVPGALGTTASPNLTYQANADPIAAGQTGVRHFFTDNSGVIRFNAAAPANSNDAPLQ